MNTSNFLVRLSLLQGLYYTFSGVWPLLSIDTFMAVTGPKTDIWLVKTVGVLLMVSGGALLMAWMRKRIYAEIVWLAVGDALGLILIEGVYVFSGRISAIYLLDAVVEIALIACWIYGWRYR